MKYNMDGELCMMNYIKQNKIFSVIMAVLLSVIFVLSFALIRGEMLSLPDEEAPEVIVEPPVDSQEPNITNPVTPIASKALIKNFFGTYHEDTHMIALSWKVIKNYSNIQSIHLYRDDVYIADVTNATSYELPINMYGVSTGPNLFQLKVDLEDEEDSFSSCYVTLDYVMDVVKDYQFVNNSLGKGMLLRLNYNYNKQTPVGVPQIKVTTTAPGDVMITHISTTEAELGSGYINATTTYFLDTSYLPEQSASWSIHYSFISVGVNIEMFISEDLSEVEYSEEEMTPDENDEEKQEENEESYDVES